MPTLDHSRPPRSSAPVPTIRPPDDPPEAAARLLAVWFGDLDDASELDPSVEPFRAHYQRWYGKNADVDRELRAAFEPTLLRTVAQGARWEEELADWARSPASSLALVILLDQLPRNLYRGTARMYEHDALALGVAVEADRERRFAGLPLVHRLFGLVPLLHAENRTLQDHAVRRFGELAADAHARARTPAFFERALESARRHRDVVREYGRFPHRNALLGRVSTISEAVYLAGPDPGF